MNIQKILGAGIVALCTMLAAQASFGQSPVNPNMGGSVLSAMTPEQRELAKRLPQTVVVRVSNQTGVAEVLESKAALKADVSSIATLNSKDFKPVDVNSVVKSGPDELDSYVSRDSWYRSWNRGGFGRGYGYGRGFGGRWGGLGYYPGYNYYGYNYYYNPYYSYYNPNYSYYYYGCY